MKHTTIIMAIIRSLLFPVMFLVLEIFQESNMNAAQLKAGIAKLNITEMKSRFINDSLYVKALVLDDGAKKVVIITLDAVSMDPRFA